MATDKTSLCTGIKFINTDIRGDTYERGCHNLKAGQTMIRSY